MHKLKTAKKFELRKILSLNQLVQATESHCLDRPYAAEL